MLVSATDMLKKAKAGHYAVGQFNINNLEWTKAILLTAQELNSPVILGVSEGAGKYMTGYKTVVGMVNGMLDELVIEHRKCRFTSPPRKTYAVWFDDVESDGSDDIEMLWTHNFTIELYAYKQDEADREEEKIEKYLAEKGIKYHKQSQYWIQSEQLYQTVYSFTITNKQKGMIL